MENIQINAANEFEAEQIFKIIASVDSENQEFSENNKNSEFKKNELESIQRIISDRNSFFLLAKLNGKTIGFAGFRIGETPETDDIAVFSIAILKPFRGKGIGKMLIEETIEKAKSQQSLNKIILTVDESNSVAKSFYTKFGFIDSGKYSGKTLMHLNLKTDL